MIYIAGDEHGFKAIQFIESYLRREKIPFKNVGVSSADEELSLEKMIPRIAKGVKKNKRNKGVLVCGTGIGVMIGANKIRGIRASLVTNQKLAEWCSMYDNCNVICLVGWDAKSPNIGKIMNAWLTTKYDGSKKRLKMLKTFESWR